MTLTAERQKLRYELKRALFIQRRELKRVKLEKIGREKMIKHYQGLLKRRKARRK